MTNIDHLFVGEPIEDEFLLHARADSNGRDLHIRITGHINGLALVMISARVLREALTTAKETAPTQVIDNLNFMADYLDQLTKTKAVESRTIKSSAQ